jgi:hypothetical protein
MVWDVLFQIGASILLGAAVGYGVSAIVKALSKAFAKLWEGFVGAVQEIWGHVTEATQHLLAVIVQWMDQAWTEIEEYLRQEFGYRREWWVAIFRKAQEVFVGFVDPLSAQGESTVVSLGVLEPGQDVQLPTSQNPIVRTLVL